MRVLTEAVENESACGIKREQESSHNHPNVGFQPFSSGSPSLLLPVAECGLPLLHQTADSREHTQTGRKTRR